MAASEDKKQKCATIIPQNWPQLTGPKATMNVDKDRSAWFSFLREQNRVGVNPKVYRGPKDK